jgi:hypothetical protein
MAKKEIKEQNKDLEIHVVDLISKFDPSETNKYTKFLTKILKKHLDWQKEQEEKRLKKIKNSIRRNRHNSNERPRGENELENLLINYLTDVLGSENLDTLNSFHKHVEENRITGKDVNMYDSWDSIQKDVTMADIKQHEKLLKKEIRIIFENEGWVFLSPLTMESSLTYGAGTKWCTASKNNKEYFYRYSKNGVLCYVISKLSGDKYGLFYDIENSEFSIWDVVDRRIDSVQTTIPLDLLSNIYKIMKLSSHNYSYFSEEEKKKCDSYWDKYNLEVQPLEDAVLMEEIPTEIREEDFVEYISYPISDEEPMNDIVTSENPWDEEELPI